MLNDQKAAELKTPTPAPWRAYSQPGLIAISVIGLCYYLIVLDWNLLEVIQVILGLMVLWGPLTGWGYFLLRKQVTDSIVRFTLSIIAAYALTTLAYFVFSVIQLTFLFYIVLGGLAVGLLLYLIWKSKRKISDIKNWAGFSPRNWLQLNWLLVMLIVVSLVINIQYEKAYKVDSLTGNRTFILCYDQTYFVSQAYELDRNVPPLQQSVRAGLPERAYHMFPHLTTMLIGRFTGQADLMRAHLIYHYSLLVILMCLVFYSIVKTLCHSRWAGYMGLSVVYILAVPFPAIKNNTLLYFYFTLDPHVSSGLDPVALTSPQMYSGLLVVYGIFLGSLLISRRFYARQEVGWLLLVIALMVGAMTRFRIQIFLPLLPIFLLLCFYGWWRIRQKIYLWGAGIALVTSVLLYLEMQQSPYLPNTANLIIGNNGLAALVPWINSWPGSEFIAVLLSLIVGDGSTFYSLWQFISMSAFVGLNMLGIPLLLITFFYLKSKQARRQDFFFSFMLGGLIILSTIGAMLISTSYDNYSVGGQMLLHTYWYAAPLTGVAFWYIYKLLRNRLSWSRQHWQAVGGIILLTALIAQLFMRPSYLQNDLAANGLTINSSEWQALNYLHDQTPTNAVVISNKHLTESLPIFTAVFSGIGGRAAYFEYATQTSQDLAGGPNSQEDRMAIVKNLWDTANSVQFCSLLTSTIATHLVEYADQPLTVVQPICLQQVWSSPGSVNKVSIWKVQR
jgi:hypothetical protein